MANKFQPGSRLPGNYSSLFGASTPEAKIAAEAAREFAKPLAAITATAISGISAERFKAVSQECYGQFGKRFEEMRIIVTEFNRRWREFGATKDLACVEVFSCGRDALRKKFLYWNANLGEFPASFDDDKDKKDTLKAISELPPEPKTAEEWEEKEHYTEPPRVKTAPEVIVDAADKNGHVEPVKPKASENGKPKAQLAVWKKAEDCAGAFLRAVDDIHRVCPYSVLHDDIIGRIKMDIKLLERWKSNAGSLA